MIEILVVVFIIALLSGLLISNFNNFSRQKDFQNAAEEMLANIRLIQNHTLSGFNDCTDTTNPDGSPYIWLGWYIKPLFQASTPDTSYKIGEICWDGKTYSGGFKIISMPKNIQEIKLPKDIVIVSMLNGLGQCASNNGGVDPIFFYNFSSPNGNLWIDHIFMSGDRDYPLQVGINCVGDWYCGQPTGSVAIKLKDQNETDSDKQYKGIGISPVGGTILKNLKAGDWPCPNGSTWPIF